MAKKAERNCLKMLYLFPPNYSKINAKFNVRGKRIIFAWGDTVFNPARIDIPTELFVHEGVHQKQQGYDPAQWWERYLDDEDFRLMQEIPAHQAEYRSVFARTPEEAKREDALHRIADRLSSPLYGSLVTYDTARIMITHNAEGTARY